MKSKTKTIILGLIVTLASSIFINSALASDQNEAQNEQKLEVEQLQQTNYIKVPEVRNKSNSRTIEVAYVRFKSTNKGLPLFVVLGGPGDSILQPNLMYWKKDIEPFLGLGDVIIVEQRGIGASIPNLSCGTNSWPLDKPMEEQTTLKFMRETLKRCVSQWVEQGVDFEGYNQVEIARDVDAIRQQLGYSKINITGGSFGSAVGYQYMRDFPDQVNRSILTQMLAPNSTFHQPGKIDSYVDKLGGMAVKFGLFQKSSDLSELIRSTINKVKQAPVHGMFEQQKVAIGAFDIQLITTLGLRRTREMLMLPQIYQQMASGNFDLMAMLSVKYLRNNIPLHAAVMAIDCSAGATAAKRETIKSEEPGSLFGKAVNAPFPYLCDEIEHGDIGAKNREITQISLPTLVIVGELDARTNVEDARRVVAKITNGSLLIIQNASHDLGQHNVEVHKKIIDQQLKFLQTGLIDSDTIVAPIQ